MTKVICAEDCGNSPRNLLLKQLLTAFAKGNGKFILGKLAEDVTWQCPGAVSLRGKAAVAQLLAAMQREPVAELVIDNILTHGPAGAANGLMKLVSGKAYAFSHVYRFKSAGNPLIKEVTVYLIKT